MRNKEQFPSYDEPRWKNTQRTRAAEVYESEGKKPFPIWTIPAIATCIALISVMIYALSGAYERYEAYRAMVSRVNVQTFYEGISVNGVPIVGLTMEEALAKIGEGETVSQEEFAVVIASGDKRWRISSQEVPLRFDTQ